MRILIQRVRRASVTINGDLHSQIGAGVMILIGVVTGDSVEDAEKLATKAARLRIFDDAEGIMNRSLTETEGEALVVSQFTLCASTRKGNRPSYIAAAGEQEAVPLYHKFCEVLGAEIGRPVLTGVFGADMQVELINDGPVTIWIDSRAKD